MSDSEIIATLVFMYMLWLTSSINKVSNSIKELTEYLKKRDKR